MRQRIRARSSSATALGRALVALLGLGLLWYGLMIVLLAFKVGPSTVNTISRYRSVYNFFAGLDQSDIDDRVRLIAALAGLAAFLVLGLLAWKQVPRPYLARHELLLQNAERGTVRVGPRAIERAAELAAMEEPAVSESTGRFADAQLDVDVHVRRSGDVPDTIRGVQGRVTDALTRHGLPAVPVNVTLTGFDSNRRRELD